MTLYFCIGTGKSATVVETVAQIVKLKPKAHILITSRSNVACDDVANRLLKYVSVNKILRLYSASFERKKREKIDPNQKKISKYHSLQEFCTARVIICTLVNCGRFVDAKISKDDDDAKIPPEHFDYIFIGKYFHMK